VFLKPETLEFPELRRIILADIEKVVMHPTLQASVDALIGERPAVAPASEGEGGEPLTGAEAGGELGAAEGAAGAPEEGAAGTETRRGPAVEVSPALVDSIRQTIRRLNELLERLEGGG